MTPSLPHTGPGGGRSHRGHTHCPAKHTAPKAHTVSPQVSAEDGAGQSQGTPAAENRDHSLPTPTAHSRQCPAEVTCRLICCVQAWTCNSHSLAYVRPSEPHTGWAKATHSEGHTQRPVSASHKAPKRHCPQRSEERLHHHSDQDPSPTPLSNTHLPTTDHRVLCGPPGSPAPGHRLWLPARTCCCT